MHRSQTDASDNWYSYSYERNGRTLESYWDHPQGKDQGEPDRATYAFHCLVGHHGVFSLTPVWILSAVGLLIWLIRGGDGKRVEYVECGKYRSEMNCGEGDVAEKDSENGGREKDVSEKEGNAGQLRLLSLAIGALTLIVLGFYLGNRPEIDRNYGGMTCGLRWTFWLIPLWLVGMVPTLDGISGRGRWANRARWAAIVGLIVSVFSVVWPYNPWTDPWLEEFMVAWPSLWGG